MTIVFHPRALDHLQGSSTHPESPARLKAVRARLEAEGLWHDVIEPEPASREALERVHRRPYLDRLAAFGEGWWDADTFVRPETFEIARLAAGGAIRAAHEMDSGNKPTLALHRPPGHHATPGEAMGFCYLNNVALAAAELRAMGRERIAIIDVDVHHGNGTEVAFYNRRDVLFFSTHQSPLYPGTGRVDMLGEGEGEGYNLNVPLPPGSGDATFDEVMERLLAPIIAQYKPGAILLSLGADAHYKDPLAQLTLSTPGLVRWVASVRRLARAHCEDRLMICLEGGYHVDALADVIAGVAAGIEGREVEAKFSEVADDAGRGKAAIAEAARYFSEFWKL